MNNLADLVDSDHVPRLEQENRELRAEFETFRGGEGKEELTLEEKDELPSGESSSVQSSTTSHAPRGLAMDPFNVGPGDQETLTLGRTRSQTPANSERNSELPRPFLSTLLPKSD